jgi:hypothetical protein
MKSFIFAMVLAWLANFTPAYSTPLQISDWKNQISVLPNRQSVRDVYNALYDREEKNRSQCFNRAHVWSYDLLKNESITTGKIFVFFTPKFMRSHRFDWWFHVAPYVKYKEDDGSIQEAVVDRLFDSAVMLAEWSTAFTGDDITCKTISHYTEYSEHLEDEYCYTLKVPLYTWTIKDVQALEKGSVRSSFVESDVQFARQQAFYLR